MGESRVRIIKLLMGICASAPDPAPTKGQVVKRLPAASLGY